MEQELKEIMLWLLPLIIWDLAWRGVALWKSSKNNQLVWFIFLLIFNTVGILPLIYILFFQDKIKDNQK
ncbi:MAG: DUF5652 family protein [Candidatus Moraniibacteriota bacterium]